MSLRTPLALLLALVPFATACSSTPQMTLDLQANPKGTQVYLSRRGDKSVQTKIGPIKGDVKAEPLQEEFLLLGTTPLIYTTPLVETESDATVMGFGGRVVLKYREGVLRFEKPGFETVERHVRIADGEMRVKVKLPANVPETAK